MRSHRTKIRSLVHSTFVQHCCHSHSAICSNQSHHKTFHSLSSVIASRAREGGHHEHRTNATHSPKIRDRRKTCVCFCVLPCALSVSYSRSRPAPSGKQNKKRVSFQPAHPPIGTSFRSTLATHSRPRGAIPIVYGGWQIV